MPQKDNAMFIMLTSMYTSEPLLINLNMIESIHSFCNGSSLCTPLNEEVYKVKESIKDIQHIISAQVASPSNQRSSL